MPVLDPKSAARRLIIERIILAGFVAVLIGIMVAAKVAWGQEVDPTPTYPIDLNAIVWGAGGTTLAGVGGAIAWGLWRKLGLKIRRIEIAGDSPKPDEESSSPIDSGGMRAALDALREEQREAHEAARKDRAELRESIADLRSDLYPKHDDPLAVQVRQLAANAQDTPKAVKQLTKTLLARLDRMETDIKGAGGGRSSGGNDGG